MRFWGSRTRKKRDGEAKEKKVVRQNDKDQTALQEKAEKWWFSLTEEQRNDIQDAEDSRFRILFLPSRIRKKFWYLYIGLLFIAGALLLRLSPFFPLKIVGFFLLYLEWQVISGAERRKKRDLVFWDAPSALDVIALYRLYGMKDDNCRTSTLETDHPVPGVGERSGDSNR